jgi:hypothetical protein
VGSTKDKPNNLTETIWGLYMRILFILMALCACSNQSFAVEAKITDIQIILPGEQPIASQQQLDKDQQYPIFDMGGVILTVDYGKNEELADDIKILRSKGEIKSSCELRSVGGARGISAEMNVTRHMAKTGTVLKTCGPLRIIESIKKGGLIISSNTPLRGKYKFYLDDLYGFVALLSESILSRCIGDREFNEVELDVIIPSAEYANYLDILRILLPIDMRVSLGYKTMFDEKKINSSYYTLKYKLISDYTEALNTVICKLANDNKSSQVSFNDFLNLSLGVFKLKQKKGSNSSIDAGFLFYIESVADDSFQDIHTIFENNGKYDEDTFIRFVRDSEGRNNICIKYAGIGQNAMIRNFARQVFQKSCDESSNSGATIPDAKLDVRFEFGDGVIDNFHSRLMDPEVMEQFTINDMTYVLEQS